MLFGYGVNDLHLPVFGDPLNDGLLYVIHSLLGERGHHLYPLRSPGIIKTGMKAIHYVRLALTLSLDAPQEVDQHIILDLMQLVGVLREERGEVIPDAVAVVPLCCGGESVLDSLYPCGHVRYHIGLLLRVLLDVEDAPLLVGLHHGEELVCEDESVVMTLIRGSLEHLAVTRIRLDAILLFLLTIPPPDKPRGPSLLPQTHLPTHTHTPIIIWGHDTGSGRGGQGHVSPS